MAAMYKIMPKALEETVMFKSEDFSSYEEFFDRLVAYSSTKNSMTIGDTPAKSQNTKDVGSVAPGDRKAHVECWECSEYGHFGRDAPSQEGRRP